MGKLNHTISDEDENLIGMEARMQKMYSLLGTGSTDVRIVGIWGMSGVGKTTLARAIFDKISNHFEAASFVHDIRNNSEKYGLERLQKKLLSKILMLKDLKIDNVYEGIRMAKTRLRNKRILVVLDDVDHRDQLEALAGKHEWFGEGSRIIITTKNKHLLVTHEVDKFYKVGILSSDEAIQLFCRSAFKEDHPSEGYEELSTEVIRYAGGLPLALKVLGCSLYDADMTEWRSTMDRLKKIPEDEILEKLKVSFDGLNGIDKEILLDIACFLNGKKKNSIIRLLDSFDFSPVIGVKVLTEKSLITVSKGRIWMHQLIQEMAWHVVRQPNPNEPGKYSRLWDVEDVSDVLIRNTGTERVEGIWLDLSAPKDINISTEAFIKMNKLRLLKVHNAYVSRGPDHLPEGLRWLSWHGFPSKSLPSSFEAKMIVGLKLQNSRIIQLWTGTKLLEKLKYINLSHSQKLVRAPDFTGIPNLERLILENCTSLVEIHPSIGALRKLRILNLKDCKSLKCFPSTIQLESLEIFILSGCLKLKMFPEFRGNMKKLSEIYAEATAIKELPPSIGQLSGLLLMNLSYCENLVSLPTTICGMTSLRTLILSGCSKLEKLPEELGQIECLQELHVDETAIQEPPTSISLLKNLKFLSFRGCKQVTSQSWNILSFSRLASRKCQLPKSLVFPSVSGLCSLVKLDLSDCGLSDVDIPLDFGSLSSLVELNLSRNNFVNIPTSSINGLPGLQVVQLVGCTRLESLPQLPSSITEIYADDCTSLKTNIDTLTTCQKLYTVSFTNCLQLLQELQRHSKFDILWQHLLQGLSVRNSKFSICIPGGYVPEWFTLQMTGSSISVELPLNWYSDKFMGFAICAVSDLITTTLTVSHAYLKKIPGIRVQFKITSQDGKNGRYLLSIGNIGADKNVDLEHTCLAYLPFDRLWSLYSRKNKRASPNDWCQIDISADDLSRRYFVLKSWGIRLVYKEDIKQDDEILMIQDAE